MVVESGEVERIHMTDDMVSSDFQVLDFLRTCESMTVTDLAGELEVTATAVRQRLNRLMGQGLIERTATKAGRGRPSHRYRLTSAGRRKAGANFADLAVALWQEVVAIQDPEVRRALIQSVSRRLAETYSVRVEGRSVEQRMEQLSSLFRERRVPFQVESDNGRPILKAVSCPYPDLANGDRNICALERQMFNRVLGTRLKIRECRLDGDHCCSFEPEVLEISDVSE